MDKYLYKIKDYSKILIIIIAFFTIPFQLVHYIDSNISSEGYIKLSTTVDKKKCLLYFSEEKCSLSLEDGKYFFNNNDLESIKNYPEVTDVYASVSGMHTKNSDNSELKDNSITTLDLTVTDVYGTTLKTGFFTPYNLLDVTVLPYEFSSLELPFEVLKNTGLTNPSYAATLLVNDVLENNSKYESIIIPKHLSEIFGVVEGDIVSLPVKVLTKEGYNEESKNYFVAGIYEDKGLTIEQKKYIFVDYVNLASYDNPQNLYNKINSIYGVNSIDPALENEEKFDETYSPYYDEISIFTNDEESTIKKLEEQYPIQSIETSDTFKNIVSSQLFIYKLLLIIFFIIFLLLNMYNAIYLYNNNLNEKINKIRLFNIVELSILVIFIQYFERFLLFKGYNYFYHIYLSYVLITIALIIILYIPYIVLKIKLSKK